MMHIATNVLSSDILTSRPIQVLAAFVAVNSLIFVVLAVMSILPKTHPSTWFTSRDRRSETRSINPNARR